MVDRLAGNYFVDTLGWFCIGYWFRSLMTMTDGIVNVQDVDASLNCWTIAFDVAVASFDVVADVNQVAQIYANKEQYLLEINQKCKMNFLQNSR